MKFIRDIQGKLDTILDAILRREAEHRADSRPLMRHILGSVDWSDIPPENAEANINQIGPVAGLLLDMCRRLTRAEERFISADAADWNQALFGRGTLNGIELMREQFQVMQAAYQERMRPQPPVDAHNPLPE